MNKQSICQLVGWWAFFMAIVLFLTFIDQIRMNLAGQPCSVWVPAGMVINCLSWVAYGFLKEKKDWPMCTANLFGAVIGFITWATI